MSAVTFEKFMLTYSAATPQRQERALSAAVAVLDNPRQSHEAKPEPWLSLQDVTRELGYAHYSLLSRLKVQRVGHRITPGGRFKYKLSEVVEYLSSDEARAAREQMRLPRAC